MNHPMLMPPSGAAFHCASRINPLPNTDTMNHVIGRTHGSQLALPAATATQLVGTGTDRPNSARLTVFVNNTSGAALFLGGPGVNAGNGFTLASGAVFTLDATGGLWGFSTAGGTVGLLEGF